MDDNRTTMPRGLPAASRRQHRTIEIEWPDFGRGDRPAPPSGDELEGRLAALREGMARADLSHGVVYGDREHFANLAFLTGFDPRFEEALLLVSDRARPLLLVGNECEGYLTVSPLFVDGRLRSERFQPFSLLNQPRDQSRFLRDIFAEEGIGPGSRVGCIGWKYFGDAEHPDGHHAIDLPAYLVDALRERAGREQVVNATDLLMHPDHGLRTFCSPSDIAYFEYTNVLASDGMRRLLFGVRDGMLDNDLATLVGFNGDAPALELIAAGEMAATIRQDPYGQGKAAVEAAMTLLDGGELTYDDPETRSLFFPVEVVTVENVDMYMPAE
jgi:hypothetical protein